MGSQKKTPTFTINNMLFPILVIAANIFVFFYFKNHVADPKLIQQFILTPENVFAKGRWYCVITSGFIHKDMSHLLFNAVGILIFGSVAEKRFGFFKTLFIYIGALALSMFFSTFVYTFIMHKNVGIIGASGAVMGLMSCAILTDPFLITFETIIPLPLMLKGWMFFYADIHGFLGGETDRVSHLAHLFGFLSIAVIIYFLSKNDRKILLTGLIVNILSFSAFLAFSEYVAKNGNTPVLQDINILLNHIKARLSKGA
ncbi:MAG TPA: rhomboid family intramembrane serine protease [Candidatus Omnitrophota bacterium]|nr:rhomboid family intramembrane serine protease [Candidatus Omnitrophota bacterium]